MLVTRFAAAFFTFAALACAMLVAVVPRWYHVTVAEARLDIGLLQRCTVSDCSWVTFNDIEGLCTRSGSNANIRWNAVRGTVFLGALMTILALGAAIPETKGAAIVRVVALLIAATSHGFAAGFSMYFLQHWYYCDSRPCDFFAAGGETAECSDGPQLSLWVQVGAAGSSAIGAVFAVVALATFEPQANTDAAVAGGAEGAVPTGAAEIHVKEEGGETGGTGPAAAGGGGDQPQSNSSAQPSSANDNRNDGAANANATAANGNTDRELRALPPAEDGEAAEVEEGANGGEQLELPEGDWVFDEESGMYWSDEAYLFLHLESGYFYDPNSGMWYDGENWIAPEE